ncbi:MAG: hypothetical protein ACI97P_001687 [Arcticibacterium sp.]
MSIVIVGISKLHTILPNIELADMAKSVTLLNGNLETKKDLQNEGLLQRY